MTGMSDPTPADNQRAQSEADIVPDHRSLTVVAPCFNEEEGLHYLAEKLAKLQTNLGSQVVLSIVLVDDGSTDKTWDVMHDLFGRSPNVTCLRHKENLGIMAATATGIAASTDEAVAVIDSDCSYDPALISKMLPLLKEDTSIVTASPYHPQGQVEGVPEWRLFLSKGASWGYRQLLRNNLATYTSCFRLYRKSSVVSLPRRHDGFSGVAEVLALLDRRGWRIDEVPAVLTTRKYGQSKLKLMRVVRDHLSLMSSIAVGKIFFNRIPPQEVSAGPQVRGERD
ncbi:glycosyltransferase family 2 protein [Ruegeria sp. HKCCA4707]|uniref:glycosyltransferase family 2 protein n=1 Tax=Ruegeria sp. HKCCA4707 TaxID=2682984 RepID=UPI001489A94D|nr:glycosyltransferase family 2 protein [Ruegeria sp. HKCCA4707]